MIIPNLKVADMARSLAFYCNTLGLTLNMAVTPDRELTTEGGYEGVVVADLGWDGARLMLQEAESLASELPGCDAAAAPNRTNVISFAGFDHKAVLDRLDPAHIVKDPALQWYGMMELYLQDPDGHIICLAHPEGEPPA